MEVFSCFTFLVILDWSVGALEAHYSKNPLLPTGVANTPVRHPNNPAIPSQKNAD
jgi:hypothetical protein